ncbi:ABC transporter ATP-binding protein [Caldalkalibacillus mannanilyticus]|uniref:ABC transporter ATP-binding protein n=1 Tax=Caldalkalibacillus mannanilyticus TaxID=1418 RepID=UPI0004688731|nr:ABC transporter ATP-binding protein [Caldalkalibacillus mannanilyticus]
MNPSRTGLLRLIQLAGEKKKLLLWAAISSIVSSLFLLVPYLSIYFILAELLQHAKSPLEADGASMLRWSFMALGGFVSGLIALYISLMCSHVAAFRILFDLRVKLAEHISHLPLGFLTKTSTGAVKKTVDQNVEKIENFVAHQFPDLIGAMVTGLVMFIVMLSLNVWLAIASILPLIIGLIAQFTFMSKQKTNGYMKRYHDALEAMNASTVQYIRGMPAIKAFNQTVHSFRQFQQTLLDYREYCLYITAQFQTRFILFKTMLASIIIFSLPVGIYFLSIDSGNLLFAQTLLFFLLMAPAMATPMTKLLSLSRSLTDIIEGVKRIDEILLTKPLPEARARTLPNSYEITFENVTFSYGSDKQSALQDVSFRAEKGQITALVGPSGSGKSTIATLIPRFYDVSSGRILIGGVDIRHIQQDDLMNLVSFVFQDTVLFYDSIYENIWIGNPKATKEEIVMAAKAAQCHTFIEKLPNGYDTLIGEGGIHLSGGEEQRLAVARAILKDAPILILDEATAYADPENEHAMHQALSELMKGKTVLVIAHRMPSIRTADLIVVINEGKLLEQGTHEILMHQDGLYRKLWDLYVDTSSWALSKRGARV